MASRHLVLGIAVAFVVGDGPIAARAESPMAGIMLSEECPASFERGEGGRCEFRSLYQLYRATPGFGGLRAPLPPIREGFTPQQIDLGRYLFFDPLLSGTGAISCASCHRPERGFADGRARSVGATGQELSRSAPSLWNVGFLRTLFWDGRAESLEEQAKGPLFDPLEMANDPRRLDRELNANATYRRLFAEAFSLKEGERIQVAHVAAALTAFQSTLVSLNSRYDRYAHGDTNALSEQEKSGHNLFRSFVTRCTQCHSPPLFTIDELAVTGVPGPADLPFDVGAEAVSNDASQRGAFKIPTLRNISLTAPYMHAGSLPTLEDAIQFYNDERGHAMRDGEDLLIHWHIALPEKTLTRQEVVELGAFLEALTDVSAMPRIPETLPSGLLPSHGEEGRP